MSSELIKLREDLIKKSNETEDQASQFDNELSIAMTLSRAIVYQEIANIIGNILIEDK